MNLEHSSLIQKLEEAAKNRQLEEFFSKVLEMCRNNQNFALPSVILPYFQKYCASLGSLSAHSLAVDLVEIVRNGQSIIAALTLLRNLVCSVQILNASKLREFVKNDLVELHNELFAASKKCSTPTSCALISYCVFYTILMELSYKDGADREKLNGIWEKVMKNEKSIENPVLLLCSFLWSLLLGENSNGYSEKLVESVNLARLKKAEKGYIQEFFTLVEQHLASIVIHFSAENLPVFMEFLIFYYLENNSLETLANLILSYPELRNNYKDRLVELIQKVLLKKKIEIVGWDALLKKEDHLSKSKNQYQPTMVLDFQVLSDIINKDSSLKLLTEVLYNAKDDKINSFLSKIQADSFEKENLCQLFQILTIFAKRERPGLLAVSDEIFMLMSRDDAKNNWKFEFAAAFIPMLKGHKMFHDFVLLVTTFLSVSKPTEFQANSNEKRISKIIKESTLRAKVLESIFTVPEEASSLFSTIGLELADLILKVSELKRAKVFIDFEKSSQKLDESIYQLKRELRHFEHVVNTICYKIGRNEKIFVRYIPFVISNCLTGDREPSLAVHRLLSICDQHGIALLSTNLPPVEKRKFAVTFPQFQKSNKFEI
uniref:Uncharacterized protein n=1 Tax=Acrobeloides nanus TaxID=290746 RepID=A0A914CXZ0_9BILA